MKILTAITLLKRFMNRKQAEILEELIKEAVKLKVLSQRDLQSLKNRYSFKYKIGSPTNVSLIKTYRFLLENGSIKANPVFFDMLKKRKVRSQSGIANITVLTKGYKCPGTCIFCPSEPDMPKSYLSTEPAMMRAILNDFDSYRQVKNRLKGLERTGHTTEKVEIIVAGGTFSYYPKAYQTYFVRNIFNALNEKKFRSLKAAQDYNEKAEHRCVGLSLETRPDWITIEEIKRMRMLGATKVEIGIQSLDDEILAANKRGHGVDAVRKAMKLLKDAGFKINAHMMPNLYKSNIQKDKDAFKKLFEDDDFKPDWLKIYPCVVTPYSQLEKLFRSGEYKPYTDEELIDLIIVLKKIVPEYTRIARLYRDIPAENILGGSKLSNLRQIVQKKMAEEGDRCKCIRCREVKDYISKEGDIELVVREYNSSGGKEFFLSFEDVKNDKLLSFLRLRFPSQIFTGEKHFIKELQNSALIRELHTYGAHLAILERKGSASQHKGYGKRLLEKAEEITKKHGIKNLAVISGIGVREYYKKLGFKLKGSYMSKKAV
ncbi:tRNA uridine(34) 5-carboxymethylaminomethyl modification radical SAM/GNAT enzyme Elp3 [bacterium]|nr:tRNA uridine(34) 5-carboxymethylaminomethyl modification radical SAM/GNAT enzyme Elp3 [bacterium]